MTAKMRVGDGSRLIGAGLRRQDDVQKGRTTWYKSLLGRGGGCAQLYKCTRLGTSSERLSRSSKGQFRGNEVRSEISASKGETSCSLESLEEVGIHLMYNRQGVVQSWGVEVPRILLRRGLGLHDRDGRQWWERRG